MNRINKFLEVFWLVISIISIIAVIYVYTKIGKEDNFIILFFPVISVAMFIFRRYMSKRYREHKN
jgi:hypothetical protein